jgi:hypothetical protein
VVTNADGTSTGKSTFGQAFKPGDISNSSYGTAYFQGVWNGTAAITSITLNSGGVTMGSGTYIQLYGIKE